MLKNRERVEVFHRTIPKKSVNNAFLVIFLSLISVGVCSMVLFWTEDFEFRRVIFEVVSAFGTVGLSTGITPLLTDAGKFALIALMFVGRIGPISMVVAMSHHGVPEKYGYPESEVMVG
jgi:trk system potassium uptake protein TrkH